MAADDKLRRAIAAWMSTYPGGVAFDYFRAHRAGRHDTPPTDEEILRFLEQAREFTQGRCAVIVEQEAELRKLRNQRSEIRKFLGLGE